jgi:hypothetical protein
MKRLFFFFSFSFSFFFFFFFFYRAPAANAPDVPQPVGLLYYPMLWKFPLV